jgi:hypothetical protein
MRPPDCYVCHLMRYEVPDDGRDYFTLVRFGATEEVKMAPSRAMEAVGRTGHPYNAICSATSICRSAASTPTKTSTRRWP